MKRHTSIEPLESRIAPAAVFTFTDVDGDAVTVKTSKGTNADLLAAITTTVPAGSVAGGVKINTLNLATNMVFDGTDLSITAKPGPLGGDGLVNVRSIFAVGLDLGTVKVGGDLEELDAGKSSPTSKIKTIDVQSTSGATFWGLAANVGTIKVAGDLRGAEIDMLGPGATLGTLQIGGSLIGESVAGTGYINIPTGTIGKVIIKGDIVGGTNIQCGKIKANDILSVSIGGSILGGSAADSGQISASGKLGPVTIGGSIRGGDGMRSGQIQTSGSLGPVKIGGSLVGGGGDDSGLISGSVAIASVTIAGDIIGDSGGQSGTISSTGGDIGPVKIGGSMLGGTGNFSGSIRAFLGKIGNVTIRGDMIASGAFSAKIAGLGIGAVKIGGSLVGAGNGSGVIEASGTPEGGFLTIKSVSIGGRVERADIRTTAGDTQIGPVKVGGDWIASNITTDIFSGADSVFGTADDTGTGGDPALFTKIASITIGGKVSGTVGGTDHFGFVSQEIGSLKIHGVSIPLAKGRGNDTNVANTQHILGATRDVTVHEVL